MNKQEYIEYQAAVADFMERENLTHLTTGEPWCEPCSARLGWDVEQCPDCGGDRTWANNPYFSSNGCDCCGSTLGCDLEFASGCDKDTNEIKEYEVCQDCAYYAEFRRLDDMQMLEIEKGREEEC